VLAATPKPPYVAVIFASRSSADTAGYAEAAQRMVELAARQPGFLGVDSTRGPDGTGITVSYWVDEDAVRAWRADVEHTEARRTGRQRWYDEFSVRVAHVSRATCWDRSAGGPGSGQDPSS
jgi:heme-degrading monooxygenase HmoA